MAEKKALSKNDSQAEKFIDAARGLGCDESETTFDAAIKKVAKHKPVSDPPAPEKKPTTKKPAE